MTLTPFIREVDQRFRDIENSISVSVLFKYIQADAGTTIAADSSADTLTFTSPNNLLSISSDALTDTVTLEVNQGNIDHGALGGLGDDDHTQYHTDARALAWLNTRAASDLSNGTTGSGAIVLAGSPTFTTQITTPIVYGSAASGGDLRLHSTSHGTKGLIYLGANSAYDQVNDRLGIGLTNPNATLTVNGNTGLRSYVTMSDGLTTSGIFGPGSQFSGAANQFAIQGQTDILFYTSGSGSAYKAILTSTGRLGIGSDIVPGCPLDVDGNIQGRGTSTNATFTGPGVVSIKNATDNSWYGWHKDDGTRTAFAQSRAGIDFKLTTEENVPITFLPNAVLQMSVATTGVTVVTQVTSPIVYGSAASAGDLQLHSTSHATKGKILLGASSAYDGANVRLGIGTAAPATLGEFSQAVLADGTTPAILRISGLLNSNGWTIGAPIGQLEFYNSDVGQGGAGVRARLQCVAENTLGSEWGLAFSTALANAAPTEKVRIDGAGSVGIGTTLPLALLDVSKTVAADGSTPSIIRISGLLNSQAWSTGAEIGKLEFYNNDGSSGGAGVRGNIAIVTTSATGNNWDMVFKTSAANAAPVEGLRIKSSQIVQMANYGAGTATFDASGNISSVSDETMKSISGYFEHGIEAIAGIKPIVYRFKEESGLETQTDYIGFSAQNVRDSIPSAVGMNKNGTLSLQDRAIMAAMVNAIKELNNRISLLENAP